LKKSSYFLFKFMVLIVGLGNPGKKFQKTRHNLGFRVIDEFKRKNNFPDFVLKKELNSLISAKKITGQKIILAKPQTFMNNSGLAVKSLIHFYKIKPQNVVVIHDDIDLPLGKIKVVKNRGSGGHKGVESVIKALKTKNFIRFRLGIQPKKGKPKKVENFVLQNFTKEEEKIIKELLKLTVKGLETFLKEGVEKTMTQLNRKSF